LYRVETKKQELCLACGNEYTNLIKSAQNTILRMYKPRYEGALKLFLEGRENKLNSLCRWAPNLHYQPNGVVQHYQPEGAEAVLCPKCGQKKPLTRHHVFKSYVFGNEGLIIYFCRDCHNQIEYFITRMETCTLKPYKSMYECLHEAFMQTNEPLNTSAIISTCQAAGIPIYTE
jgi:hypothetical protein